MQRLACMLSLQPVYEVEAQPAANLTALFGACARDKPAMQGQTVGGGQFATSLVARVSSVHPGEV
jgi:hypothetical protein